MLIKGTVAPGSTILDVGNLCPGLLSLVFTRLRTAVQKSREVFGWALPLPVPRKGFLGTKRQAPVRRSAAMLAATNPLKPLLAVGQLTSTPDKEHNYACCAGLIREAAQRGACIVFLPEAFDFVGSCTEETLGLSETLDGDTVQRYAGLARECGVWLSLGGFHERGSDWECTRRIYNAHLLLDSQGSLVATYRKTHLFNAELKGRVSLQETAYTNPGPEIVPPISTPAGKVQKRSLWEGSFL
ncbi:hypothetical protein lerEdw1_013366 [Lerista edwardsae]|nr:hypothetical protein lerEdw1_013366 [Lerista edwardsae]